MIALALSLLLSAAAETPKAPAENIEQSAQQESQLEIFSLHRAAISLPLAAALAGVLAYRPRRRGHAPPRNPEVVQTQVMLALVGALVMLVVGASLARAFGIAGAAGLVRYRSKVSDPKDASVMLSSLGIGLAAGVGLFWLATVATAFIVVVLWGLEFLEPRKIELFELVVKDAATAELRPRVDALLKRHRLKHAVRSSSADEFSYEVEVPFGFRLEPISEAILKSDPGKPPALEWKRQD